MAYDYTTGDGLSVLNDAEPNGATEPVSVLDNAVRQIKKYLKDTEVGPKALIDALREEVKNEVKVVVTHTGGQDFSESDGATVVKFDNEDLDIGNDFNPVTFKFTAPEDGLYLCIAGLTLNPTASSSPEGIVHQMDLFVDAVSGARTRVNRGDDASVVDLQLSRLFNLSAGQTLSVKYTLSVDSGTLTMELLNDPRETVFQVTKIPSQTP